MSRVVGVAAAIALTTLAVVKGTWAVGGSDSSCYGLMAEAFAHGRLQPVSALALDAPWPDAPRTAAPAGFIPSPVRQDAASPICAPGFSLLMAPFVAVGGRDGVFWLTPLAAGLLVWLAFVLARRLAGGMAGAVAAVIVAFSPIVLYQAVQPMNDITCAALWLAAFVVATSESSSRATWSGLLTGMAILVRPNLVTLAPIILIASGSSVRSMAAFCAAAVPGLAILLGLNTRLYGSPLSSGYGDPNQLFSLSFARQNLAHYGRSLWETENVLPALGLMAPFVLTMPARRVALFALAFSLTSFATYLFYWPFPEWSYLRFLLPGLVPLLALASAAAVRVASNATMGGVVAIATVMLALSGFRTARDRQAFDLQRFEGRFRDMGTVVASRLPENAVLITVWESGSVRFHGGREIVMWDSLDPEWLDRAVSWLEERGRPAYILVERREENDFRERFRDRSAFGALDWPPRFDLNRQARIFAAADRARHLGGEVDPRPKMFAPHCASMSPMIDTSQLMKDAPTVNAGGDSLQRLPAGVTFRDAVTHSDDRGTVCEMYDPRWPWHDAPLVYAYFVTLRPGKVKGWAMHKLHEDRYFMMFGEMEVVLYDAREDSPTRGLLATVVLSEHRRRLMNIPAGIWHADVNIGSKDAVIANFPTKPYEHGEPDKYRLPLDTKQIPYSFEKRLGW